MKSKNISRSTENPQMAPKPVHPTAVRNHGLFGITFVRQHMMVDERWTPSSLTEEFHGMKDLLCKRLVFKQLEAKANRKRSMRMHRALRRQCRDGRVKLQNSLFGDNRLHVRNYLINHKDMQRLYQKMPVHLVVDNINQRTFVMRKERDRLRFRLDQLKSIYNDKLLQRAALENRIKYENEFVLEEDLKSREFRKKIENSNVRLKAIKTINGTYKKMIQILRHDGIFYEPILRSLSKDIEDQTQFIKHVLFIGMPAIVKFKELNEEYRVMEDKSRKNLQAKMAWVANFRKEAMSKRMSMGMSKMGKTDEDAKTDRDRYVRETNSMQAMKTKLEDVHDTIKKVKTVTLTSQPTEIFPRIKSQMDNNRILNKKIQNDVMTHNNLVMKLRRADVLEGVLINNLSDDELDRLQKINELQEAISKEDRFEMENIAHMKNRGKTYILMRVALWNLNEILRHVGRPQRSSRLQYPNSYLRLPLLKFEMLTMRACPPDLYEENLDSLMDVVKRKIYKLMQVYKSSMSTETKLRCAEEYHRTYLETVEGDDMAEEETGVVPEEEEEEQLDTKMLQQVPNRKAIKTLSAKIVEEMSKKDD